MTLKAAGWWWVKGVFQLCAPGTASCFGHLAYPFPCPALPCRAALDCFAIDAQIVCVVLINCHLQLQFPFLLCPTTAPLPCPFISTAMYMAICGRGKLAFMQSSRKVCKAWRLDAAQVFVVKFDYGREGEGCGGACGRWVVGRVCCLSCMSIVIVALAHFSRSSGGGSLKKGNSRRRQRRRRTRKVKGAGQIIIMCKRKS